MTNKQTIVRARSIRAASIVLAIGFYFCGNSAFAERGFFQSLVDAVESKLPDQASPTAVLSPGMVLAFGKETYAIFGTDSCSADPMYTSSRGDSECVKMTPGMATSVVLVPVGSNAPLHARVAITRTGHAITIELTSLLYPDGRAQSFTPPLIGRAGE